MEPVPRLARLPHRRVAVAVGHVARAVPLEQQLAGLDVDLLHDAVHDRLGADRPSEVRFAVPIVSARISAVFHGVIRNSWKSGMYPFAGLTVAICW